ncbi:hypothetical protein [Clostridium tertium]|jgi:hypothetical protein|uniref:hypothetical protein n=1 Tax=Clostridium tertium TaxID=1559 RepID=UPI002FEEB5BB
MKIGVRKPSIKKSIKAKTTAKAKRAVKSSVNPLYGKKGMGYINDPQKAVYNKVYNKTTIDAKDMFENNIDNTNSDASPIGVLGCLGAIIQLIVGLGQIIIYGGLLIITIWFIIQIVKL